MDESVQPLSRGELERQVLARAQQDAEFRQQLLDDPKAALLSAFGVEIPPGVEMSVLEETPSHFYLVLPFEDAEMSAEDLAKVAGGDGIVTVRIMRRLR